MRAVVIDGHGGAEVLSLQDTNAPALYAEGVRVRVRAAGLNRADVLQRRGLYPAPPGVRGDIPGLEFVGEVVESGSAATRFSPGARVMGITAGAAHAEEVVVHERTLIAVPDALEDTAAAAVPEVFMTAWDALVVQAELRRGESVLIHAAGSGVGTAAIQIADLYGATTIGTSRTEHKLERAEALGLHHTVVCPSGAFEDTCVEIVRSLSGDGGVDVVLDTVGGRYLAGNVRAMARHGRMISIGLLGGVSGELDLAAVLTRNLTLRGSTLRSRPLERKIELARAFEQQVMPAFVSGALTPVVDTVLPFTDIAEAHGLLERNETFGKVVLTW